jgi:hypothetical protein
VVYVEVVENERTMISISNELKMIINQRVVIRVLVVVQLNDYR